MKICVRVYKNPPSFNTYVEEPVVCYIMDHDDPVQRRVLGEQCRNAFEDGQTVITYPVRD